MLKPEHEVSFDSCLHFTHHISNPGTLCLRVFTSAISSSKPSATDMPHIVTLSFRSFAQVSLSQRPSKNTLSCCNLFWHSLSYFSILSLLKSLSQQILHPGYSWHSETLNVSPGLSLFMSDSPGTGNKWVPHCEGLTTTPLIDLFNISQIT